MAVLEIRHRSGMIETRELSKATPLLVGTLSSNDICVDADGVAPVHCRISWKRRNYEVAAVTGEGVQLNGTSVRQAPVAPGDVIRVGDVDIVMLAEARRQDEAGPGELFAAAEPEPDEPVETLGPVDDAESDGPESQRSREPLPSVSQIELRPISEESLPVRSFHASSLLIDEARGGQGAAAAATAKAAAEPATSKAAGSPAAPARPPKPGAVADRILEDVRDEPLEDEERVGPALSRHPERASKPARPMLVLPKVRPGERDPMRSPLVIGLSLGTLALAVAAGTIWFILAREAAQRQFDLADSLLQTGQFVQAIEAFELFVKQNPRHALAPRARVEIGTAKVEQAIGGASPAWDKALEAVQAFIDEHRETEGFQKPGSPLRQFVLQSADKIAMGSLEAAKSLHKRPLLAVSAEAVKLIELYSPSDERPEARLGELAKASQAAEKSIVQQEAVDESVQKIDAALADKEPAGALREYRHIATRYPDSARENRVLRDRLRKMLELERSITARDETPREAAAGPSAPTKAGAQLTLARLSRARSDVASQGTTVFALAEDCLYGVDGATGEPLWRRVIGLDPPFAPLAVVAGQPALLVYDARRHELVLAQERSGESIWRLPLPSRPPGPPLVYEGQIYLATEDGHLEQIDVQSGLSSARLAFSQKIVGPAAVSPSGERLFLAGYENLLYVLTRRPLGCEQVVWLGQGPGAIEAPPLMLGNYLLLAENDRQKSCLLRLFDASRAGQPPAELAGQRIDGRARDAAVLRGKELFVPSTPERISALTVSESGDKAALTLRGSYQVKDPARAPIFISAGPDDRLWMYSTALRRFELARDGLLPAKQEVAAGLACQPLQVSGDSLYLARHLAFSRGVLFGEADRQQMSAQWQIALGAGILECSSPSGQSGSVLCVTTLGDLFQLSPQRLARGGFELQGSGQVPVPEGLAESLGATRLADGRLAVYCGGAEPRLWLPGGDGLPREHKLEQALDCAPVRLAGGYLLALPGRLRLFGRAGSAVEDLPAPLGQAEPPKWLSLAAIDENNALVLSEQGRVARIQFGTAPVAHLEEVTHWDAGGAVDLPFLLAANRLFVLDAASRLVMLEPGSLEPIAQAALDGSPTTRPRPAGQQVLVELKAGRLVSFSATGKLERLWELPLEGASLAGDPLLENGLLLIALSDGRVLRVEPATGQVAATIDLGQQLAFGPVQWGETVVVGTLDGTIVALKE